MEIVLQGLAGVAVVAGLFWAAVLAWNAYLGRKIAREMAMGPVGYEHPERMICVSGLAQYGGKATLDCEVLSTPKYIAMKERNLAQKIANGDYVELGVYAAEVTNVAVK